ncbi:DUF72 domain-containing protein [Aquihabitans sp. G128]|uniref:DUF72 domain-containing protein n=1 Tax=Aquihabitans sp. G128 TaxID=2849779 RepID=UPI001C21663C|nr:DUF72 domain-containing protein [Aquihabitans sp. G128]QXC59739.1 DUF72 domain-containing protein [Aquihabitans sp. G128]
MTVGAARVGCSGWVYRDWRGAVYPADLPQRRWLEAYAQAFDTVEINNTFYRLPDPSTVRSWHDQAPPGFRYALKVGQFGSHRKKLKDPETWLPTHVDRVAELGAFQGPNLLQLPPNWHRDTGRLAAFLDAAPRSARWAVELRDPSWLHDDTYRVLADHGAALCIHDLLEGVPWERTADWTYVRFHGPDAGAHPYLGRYTGRRLHRPAACLQAWLDDGSDVYAYFNNDHGANAWHDARWLADRLHGPAGSASPSTGPAPTSSAHRPARRSGASAPPHPKADPWPDDRTPSPFERAVIDAIAALAPGDLATFGEIAEEVGRPGAAQAVGNVVRHAGSLPWWRIVPSDGRIYCTHESVQVPLLEAEGHQIRDRRIL